MEGEGVGYIHGMYRVGHLGCSKVLKITRYPALYILSVFVKGNIEAWGLWRAHSKIPWGRLGNLGFTNESVQMRFSFSFEVVLEDQKVHFHYQHIKCNILNGVTLLFDEN